MESSDFSHKDEPDARCQSQMDRLVREEDFYRFVNNLSEDDYKLMRDNNCLNNPGGSTEEELLRRLQQLKENSDKNTGGGDSSDGVSSSESLLNWLRSFKDTETVTSNATCYSEIHFNLSNENSDLENEYVPSTRLPRGENIENYPSPVENLCSESTFTRPSTSEQSITEALMEVPPTRGQRRARSRSPDHRRIRARIESCWSPPHSMSEAFQRLPQGVSSPTFEQPLINVTERLSRIQHQETLRQQITGLDLQNRGLFATPGTWNAIQRESFPDTTREDESWGLRHVSPTIFLDSEVRTVHPGAYSQTDNIASITQITSETTINTVTLESEQGGPRHMFSHSEQADMRAHVSTIRVPIHRLLNTSLNDTTPVATQSSSRQRMTDVSDTSNLMTGDNDLEPSFSPSSENMENAESPIGIDISDGDWSSDSNSSPFFDLHSLPPLISSSDSNYMCSSNFSPMSSSISNDDYSDTSSLIPERLDERSLSSGSSEIRLYSRSVTPVSFDENDSWGPVALDQIFLLNNDDIKSIGLTKAQIDNLAIRYFGKNDVLNTCTICTAEYTEGNRLRVLPCSHEYHIHCIDRWLADNATCPICREKIVDSG
ncbi:PREDICTED: E3 ubiquitin-protein ligase RLIM-like [Hipposideros armiger]|uniref:RING-type E3 ubiquitin transferase n=1 Tax=Hipposideros armiger TaxID=186990 RepID=A0A8B7S7Y3_HIPAR|nr:PREDICTED: E3 ubiquitin-protein ligase RLIM-like [Hipposideros armiger]